MRPPYVLAIAVSFLVVAAAILPAITIAAPAATTSDAGPQVETPNQTVERLQDRVQIRIHNLTLLQERLRTQNQTLDRLQARLRDRDRRFEQLHEQLRQQNQTMATLRGYENHGQAVGQLRSQLRTQEQTIAQLQAAIDDQRQTVFQFRSQLRTQEQFLAGLDDPLTEPARSQVRDQLRGTATVQQQLADQESLLEREQTLLETRQRTMARYQNLPVGSARNQTLQEVHEQFRAQERSMIHLGAGFNGSDASYRHLQTQVRAMDKSASQSRAILEAMADTLNESEPANAREQFRAMAEALDTVRDQHHEQRRIHDEMTDVVDAFEHSQDRVRTSLREQNRTLALLRNQTTPGEHDRLTEQLRTQLRDQDRTMATMQDRLGELERSVERLRERLRTQEDAAGSLTGPVREYSREQLEEQRRLLEHLQLHIERDRRLLTRERNRVDDRLSTLARYRSTSGSNTAAVSLRLASTASSTAPGLDDLETELRNQEAAIEELQVEVDVLGDLTALSAAITETRIDTVTALSGLLQSVALELGDVEPTATPTTRSSTPGFHLFVALLALLAAAGIRTRPR